MQIRKLSNGVQTINFWYRVFSKKYLYKKKRIKKKENLFINKNTINLKVNFLNFIIFEKLSSKFIYFLYCKLLVKICIVNFLVLVLKFLNLSNFLRKIKEKYHKTYYFYSINYLIDKKFLYFLKKFIKKYDKSKFNFNILLNFNSSKILMSDIEFELFII